MFIFIYVLLQESKYSTTKLNCGPKTGFFFNLSVSLAAREFFHLLVCSFFERPTYTFLFLHMP